MVGTPDRCGKYTAITPLPERDGCTRDAECAWTKRRAGNCNPPLCNGHYRAGTKAWVEAVNKLHEQVCAGRTFVACERVRGRHQTPERAVCKGGTCELVFPVVP